MNQLILPDAVARRVRPLLNVPLNQILEELTARKVLHEISMTSQLPNTEEMNLNEEQIQSLKLQCIQAMFQQLTESLRTSGLCAIGTAPTLPTESLVVKIAIIKHPLVIEAEKQQLPPVLVVAQA